MFARMNKLVSQHGARNINKLIDRLYSNIVDSWGDPNSKMAGLEKVLLGMGTLLIKRLVDDGD